MPHGEWRWHHTGDGRLAAKGRADGGELWNPIRIGDWREFHSTGALAAEGKYESNRKVGLWFYHTDEGRFDHAERHSGKKPKDMGPKGEPPSLVRWAGFQVEVNGGGKHFDSIRVVHVEFFEWQQNGHVLMRLRKTPRPVDYAQSEKGGWRLGNRGRVEETTETGDPGDAGLETLRNKAQLIEAATVDQETAKKKITAAVLATLKEHHAAHGAD